MAPGLRQQLRQPVFVAAPKALFICNEAVASGIDAGRLGKRRLCAKVDALSAAESAVLKKIFV